eukprot:CAMPEP_0206020172 /NCGR_PEP_ID=MMETSP1464-20131121/30541_1 /ASSEMBLY_ACC=CAM_ASM_001124 /TAXON_ID=119497 /ORGANISM="Exanthemachrysis gayraliae, Strain RCC1523" /LENGTH=68 /DNA_ID=CAMNT_0053394099 /DNA_START=108 /DNA_END=311 /DNA_ORIENTATION=-
MMRARRAFTSMPRGWAWRPPPTLSARALSALVEMPHLRSMADSGEDSPPWDPAPGTRRPWAPSGTGGP